MTFFKSTKVNRAAQRVNAVSEIAGVALSNASPLAAVPARIAQAGVSAVSLFHPRPKPIEKVLHGFQALLSLAQAGLLIAMHYVDEDCDLSSTVCKSLLLCELMYQGVLLTGWGLSEIVREPWESDEGSSQRTDTPRLPSP